MPSTTTNTTKLAKGNHIEDTTLSQAMHGKSAKHKSAILAMMGKDSKAQQQVADAYFKYFGNKDARTETEREVQVGDEFRSSCESEGRPGKLIEAQF